MPLTRPTPSPSRSIGEAPQSELTKRLVREGLEPARAAPDFTRTLATASEAESIAKLLVRTGVGLPRRDRERLYALAERYRDYAAGLREAAGQVPAEPESGKLDLGDAA